MVLKKIGTILNKNNELAKIVLNMQKEGFIFEEKKIINKDEEKQKEIIYGWLDEFFKKRFEKIEEEIKEKRKKGKDLFLQELKKKMLNSKLDILLITHDKKDIQNFIKRIKILEIEIAKI